jgi:hypothetical protein
MNKSENNFGYVPGAMKSPAEGNLISLFVAMNGTVSFAR